MVTVVVVIVLTTVVERGFSDHGGEEAVINMNVFEIMVLNFLALFVV